MIIRDLGTVKTVDWGNGTSARLLVAADGLGYTVCDTVVTAGSKSKLQYRNHLEACYCIGGSGEVQDMDGNSFPITPGVLYALNEHDEHWLIASPDEDLHLVSVFTPALRGDEVHSLDGSGASAY
ncbi:L-ectoine synthase [Actinokineospora spheciospongiae]|uniref:L-ectoine synthase n=1 Tax=Actinokineospora spheciospongiae TaxID=909613 RepID=W7ILU4_9PSEU|nr:ectoine synthase [Actinokineospora spheciospongiae]EWC61343.1 L-ectoine synthase [Actinokineospora spheciospongiae]PWW59484.1 ectoine synthase [Actinokineospora spheciospongiae]